ncbi:MAG TPA: hypothetical protein VIG45_05545 [Erysipelothrix sp.]
MKRSRDKLIIASLFFVVFAIMAIILQNYLFLFLAIIAFSIIYLSK